MCWHRWDKWTETGRGDLFTYPDVKDLNKKVHTGQVSYQERICLKCGRKQLFCETARIAPNYELRPTLIPLDAVATQEARAEVCQKAAS